MSGSIEDENDAGTVGNWGWMLDSIKTFVDLSVISLDETRVGVVVFGNNGKIKIALGQYNDADDLKADVDTLEFKKQKTHLTGGLEVTLEAFDAANGGRSDATQVAIILYDGEPQNIDTFGSAMEEAPKLDEAGVEVFVLTLNFYFSFNRTTDNIVKALASDPDPDHLFTTKDYSGASDQVTDIRESLDAGCVGLTAAPVSVTVTGECEVFDNETCAHLTSLVIRSMLTVFLYW